MKRELLLHLAQSGLLPYKLSEVDHVDYTSGNYLQVPYVYNKSLSQKENSVAFLNVLVELEEHYELDGVLVLLSDSNLTFVSIGGGVLA